ncbi:MAG: hypothetical protein FD165_299 [Gammaproteobacteria bacterium]|nr:MAG: hypothetical protein FD165_299 [Gammaproteobacteria bacterium]TND06878.1 MAG: hypothetical protein FD120_610 [Gammaproteobacteria bacterium]
MNSLKQLLVSISLCLSVTTGVADENRTGSMKDVTVSFEILDANGNPTARFAPGEKATFRIELTNTGTQDLHDTYTAPGYEIGVYQPGTGTLLWAANAEMAFIQVIQEYVIKAGETKRLENPWDLRDVDGLPLPPGHYEVRASLNIGQLGELKPLSLTVK